MSFTISYRLYNELKNEMLADHLLYPMIEWANPKKKPVINGLKVNIAPKVTFKGFRINCKRGPKYLRYARTVINTKAIAGIDFGNLDMLIGTPQTSGASQSPVSYLPSTAAPPKSQPTPVP